MRREVEHLEGALLDAAVAKAEGWSHQEVEAMITHGPDGPGQIRYLAASSSWALGGPIIERERIALIAFAGLIRVEWSAHVGDVGDFIDTRLPLDQRYSDLDGWSGPTPLIAAMRAYVAGKFGEELELP